MLDEKAIRVIVWSSKTSDYDEWSEKHLMKVEYKGCCKLLLCEKDREGFDKVPTEKEIEDIEARVLKEKRTRRF